MPSNNDKETPTEVRLQKAESDPTRKTGSQIVINIPPNFNEEQVESDFKRVASPTVVRRWEMWISLAIFAITTGVQQTIIPEGKWTKVAMWVVSLLAQFITIFGRPLLVRGSKQIVQLDSAER